MSHSPESADAREFRALGVALILYSILFVALLAYGWYHLIGASAPAALAIPGALVMALLAWTLAKIAGGSERGIAGNKGFFVALLLVSAVGVFNTLMIRLEGKAIFVEAIDRAVREYSALPARVRARTEDREVTALRARVDALRTQLAQEIANPRNCGEGPEAAKLIAQIQAELPGFVRYSGSSRGCEGDARLMRMYDAQIAKLLQGSPAYLRANAAETEALRRRVDTEVPRELGRLERLRRDVEGGASLLGDARPRLEESASAYARLMQAATTAVPTLREDGAPSGGIDLRTVRHLGEWGHLVPLIIARLDRPQTWVYLALAVFLDWLLVQLFARLAAHRRAMPVPGHAPPMPRLETPW